MLQVPVEVGVTHPINGAVDANEAARPHVTNQAMIFDWQIAALVVLPFWIRMRVRIWNCAAFHQTPQAA